MGPSLSVLVLLTLYKVLVGYMPPFPLPYTLTTLKCWFSIVPFHPCQLHSSFWRPSSSPSKPPFSALVRTSGSPWNASHLLSSSAQLLSAPEEPTPTWQSVGLRSYRIQRLGWICYEELRMGACEKTIRCCGLCSSRAELPLMKFGVLFWCYP